MPRNLGRDRGMFCFLGHSDDFEMNFFGVGESGKNYPDHPELVGGIIQCIHNQSIFSFY